MNVVFIEHNNQSGTYLFEVPAKTLMKKQKPFWQKGETNEMRV
jgi:hypothetical protein